MEDCTVQRKPSLVLHRRKPYSRKPVPVAPLAPARRRGLLNFWRRACRRHLQAREAWRNKLNRHLQPHKFL